MIASFSGGPATASTGAPRTTTLACRPTTVWWMTVVRCTAAGARWCRADQQRVVAQQGFDATVEAHLSMGKQNDPVTDPVHVRDQVRRQDDGHLGPRDFVH